MEFDRAKVVVLGDSGVGKSAFVHLLCYQQPLPNPSYTVGCSLEVKVHRYHADSGCARLFFMEFWDIGGCASHANTRSVFYSGAVGVILIYDCTNHKSQANLRKWLPEFLQKTPVGSLESVAPVNASGVGRMGNILSYWTANDPLSTVRFRCSTREESSRLQQQLPMDSSGTAIPVLVVGTKCDLLDPNERKKKRIFHPSDPSNTPAITSQTSMVDRSGLDRNQPVTNSSVLRQHDHGTVFVDLSWTKIEYSSSNRIAKPPASKDYRFAQELGFPEIIVDSNCASSLAPSSWNAVLVDKFLDDVVWTKLSKTIGFGSNSPELLRARKFSTVDVVGQTSSVPMDSTYSLI